jgi:plastocyanin
MRQGKLLGIGLIALLSLSISSRLFAQEAQKVTITVGEKSKEVLTFEPKEVTVKPGKVQITLVNKGENVHNVSIKLKDKEVRLTKAEAGKSATTEPVDLAAGEYEIYCNYSSGGLHKDRGMAVKLIVK